MSATIAQDAQAHGAVSGSAGSLSFNHTMSSAAGGVVVVAVGGNGGQLSYVLTGVTFGGVSMTKVDEIFQNNGGGTAQDLAFYCLVNPPSGVKSVAISWTGSVANTVTGVSASYTGVLNTFPAIGEASDHGISTSTASIGQTTPVDNCWLIGVSAQGNGAGATGTGLTGIVNLNGTAVYDSNGVVGVAGSYNASLSWTGSANYVFMLFTARPLVTFSPTESLVLADTNTTVKKGLVLSALESLVLGDIKNFQKPFQIIVTEALVLGDSLVTKIKGWVNATADPSTWTPASKHSTNWTNQAEDSTSWTTQNKTPL